MTTLHDEWGRTEQQLAHTKQRLVYFHNIGEKNLNEQQAEMLKYLRVSCIALGDWRYRIAADINKLSR